VALGASTGVAVRRAGGAGGVAAAPPPVAVRRCRPAQPARKLTTAACAGVELAACFAAVDWDGPYALAVERVTMGACAGIVAQMYIEVSRDGVYVDLQQARVRLLFSVRGLWSCVLYSGGHTARGGEQAMGS
jgi:hypothetical protein